MAEDNGKWGVAVDEDAEVISTKIGSFGAKQLTIWNSGSDTVYANINSDADTVEANIAAGEGSIAIAASAAMTWKHPNIVNVVVACATSETSTITWAAVSETA
jgi:hypothetical protein